MGTTPGGGRWHGGRRSHGAAVAGARRWRRAPWPGALGCSCGIAIRIKEAEPAPAAFTAGTETICPVLQKLVVKATWTGRPPAGGGTADARRPARSPGRSPGDARPGRARLTIAAASRSGSRKPGPRRLRSRRELRRVSCPLEAGPRATWTARRPEHP